LVQGDTTTTWAASLAAFYNRIRIGHVEAGLRTGNRFSPFPEEINRILTTHLVDLHFAPTKWAAQNLIKEGIHKSKIFITGNTVIDALHIVQQKNLPLCKRGMKGDFNTIMRCHLRKPNKGVRKPAWAHRILGAVLRAQDPRCLVEGTNHLGSFPIQRITNKYVLITGHRRENKQNSSPLK
jgi:UDP-N-acetylglucosamine 2-epimerase